MESKSEPEGTAFSDLNMDEDHPPAYEPRDNNSQPVGYDQATDPKGYNLPQHALPMLPTTNTVVQVQQPTSVMAAHTRGSDLTFPAILTCFCCCFITGIPAIWYAVKAQNLYDRGDMLEAEKNQRRTRYFMVASAVLGCAIIIIINIINMMSRKNY
ncbi:Proline-rich transmembrane protein 1 [Mactra antiquata]